VSFAATVLTSGIRYAIEFEPFGASDPLSQGCARYGDRSTQYRAACGAARPAAGSSPVFEPCG
jgi:hypothetical protein